VTLVDEVSQAMTSVICPKQGIFYWNSTPRFDAVGFDFTSDNEQPNRVVFSLGSILQYTGGALKTQKNSAILN
jgi:hypothetical protein